MKYSLVLIIILFLAACAIPIAPPGGVKDVSPPQVIVQMPQSGMVNYKGDRIEFLFDEYVTFNGGEDKIIITPDMPAKPKYVVKGKKLIIKLPDNLENDITYSISLIDAIADYTEGNKTPMLRQVFSTGDKIDSASISGSVINSFDLSLVANVFVGLYSPQTKADLQSKPLYITRTSDQGQFRIDYVKEGVYYLAAIEDKNFNYVFDQVSERISLPTEVIELKGSTVLQKEIILFKNVTLNKVDDYKLLNNKKLSFNFSDQMENLTLDVKEYQESDQAYFNASNDTLFYHWTSDTLKSLTFYFTLDDSSIDTIIVPVAKNINDFELNAMSNVALNKEIVVQTPKYINSINLDGVLLMDGLNNALEFTSVTEKEQVFLLLKNPEMGVVSLVIDSGAIQYYDGRFNEKNYAKLITLDAAAPPNNLILSFNEVADKDVYLQLLNSDKKVLNEYQIKSTKSLTISDMIAGTYYIRIYEDANSNGKWTTGSLEQLLAPESTLLFSKPIEIKDNWDKEITLSF